VDRRQIFVVRHAVGFVIPPEPPVVIPGDAERPAAVKGAPGVGAAQRTLDGEDRCAIRDWTTGGLGGITKDPAGELRACVYATLSESWAVGARTSKG
jgi:hypothetical protein